MSAPPFINVKVDSGASANFHELNHHLPRQPTSSTNPSVSVIVPNGQIMTSNTTSNLPIPKLPPSATISHGFPKLASGSLLSVGQICDHNCTAIFTNKSVKMYNTSDITIKQHNEPILAGTRNAPSQPLYNIRLPIPQESKPHAINILIPQSVNATHLPHLNDRIAFYHATLFSPVISTWIKSINAGRLDSFPELTSKQVRRYTPHSEATTLGHQHAQRSNLRSTRSKASALNITSAPTKIVHLITDDDPVSLPSPPQSNKTLHIIPPEEPQQCPTSSATAPQTQQPPAPTTTRRATTMSNLFRHCATNSTTTCSNSITCFPRTSRPQNSPYLYPM